MSFSRNFGKEIAIAAGLDHARGQAVVIMDADLQHPPEPIATFVSAGAKATPWSTASARAATDEAPAQARPARAFYRLFDRFGETRLPEGAGDFRLIDRKGVEVLRSLGERARFSKGPLCVDRLQGDRRAVRRRGTPVRRHQVELAQAVPFRLRRHHLVLDRAAAGMDLSRPPDLARAPSPRPCFFVVRTLLYGTDLPGFPSLIVSVMFFSGIQLMSLGIIGEYVGRIFAEVKRRPLYIVAGAPRRPDGGGRRLVRDERRAPRL